MDAPKLEWMYKNSNETVDKEDYLLGKPIDRAFEQTQSSHANEIEKDCLPFSIFSNGTSSLQVDILRKLKEDPLEIIKQQEIERRKQLLKNPVKLKKIQNMIKERENEDSENKQKLKQKKMSKMIDDEGAKNIDNLLTSKYLKLMKKHNLKSLSDLSSMKVDKKKIKSKDKHKGSKNDSSSSETDEEIIKKTKKKRYKRKSSSSESSETDSNSDSKQKKHKSSLKKYESFSNKNRGPDKPSRQRHSSRSPSGTRRNRYNDRTKNFDNEKNRDKASDYRYQQKKEEPSWKKKQSKGLTEEEKQKRLQEMMTNAKWRDEVRTENVTKYRKEQAKEEKQKEYNEDFMRKQMALATSHGTVESRIKSNINNIQRSKFAMNENFARR